MKKTIILALIALVAAISLVPLDHTIASASWSLVYEHDVNGSPIRGDLGLLIKAIEDGKTVRIVAYTNPNQPNRGRTHAFEAEHLWIDNNVVFAQNTSGISIDWSQPAFRSGDTYHWMVLVNTSGERDIIRWQIGNHQPPVGVAHETHDNVRLAWFVGG